jgi:hypothetical protein
VHLLSRESGGVSIRQKGGNYYLIKQDAGNMEYLYSYGSEDPEFHRPRLHTPAYCEETLSHIGDSGVDLIIDDPPYGNTKQNWDTEPDWGPLAERYKRVLADDGLLDASLQIPEPLRQYY